MTALQTLTRLLFISVQPESSVTLYQHGNPTVSSFHGADSTQSATAMIGVPGVGQLPTILYLQQREHRSNRKDLAELQRVSNQQEISTSNGSYYLGFCIVKCSHCTITTWWMDSAIMLEWVKKAWKPWTLTKSIATMLIIDEYMLNMNSHLRNTITTNMMNGS